MKPIEPITQVQGAFAAIASRVNKLIAWANKQASMKVQEPLKLTEGDANAMLTIDMPKLVKAINESGVGGGGGGGGYSEGAVLNVVGTDGLLYRSVRHSTYVTTPVTYPTRLKVVNGSTSVLLDNTGLIVSVTAGYTCAISFSAIARNMAIRSISYCDSGTAKTIDVIASLPY